MTRDPFVVGQLISSLLCFPGQLYSTHNSGTPHSHYSPNTPTELTSACGVSQHLKWANNNLSGAAFCATGLPAIESVAEL